mmetsp:Transcript_32862/g.47455  ORF Transcript_32862/g.47455 Transcript_32862/m.47455 type:complete len:534 (-) Transcript_32862:1334-2935(-)
MADEENADKTELSSIPRNSSFTVAPAFNSFSSTTNLSNLANEINFIDLDSLFADDFFPAELDFTQFFEAQEKFSAYNGVSAPPMPPEMNIITNFPSSATPTAKSADVQSVIMIPPLMPRSFQIQLKKVGSDDDSDLGAKKKRTVKVKEEDQSFSTSYSNANSSTNNNSSSSGDRFKYPSVIDPLDMTESQKIERRERNREHAKKSRIRKRLLLDTLSDQLEALREENVKLRAVVREKLPGALAQKVLAECTIEESQLLVDTHLELDHSKPNNLTRTLLKLDTPYSGGIKASQLTQQQLQPNKRAQPARVLMEPDYRLIESLVVSQQNFVLSDPSLPDNPIVYASDGFCKLTGYKREHVVGRNCRFLQGEGTDQAAVEIIRHGIEEGRDVSVCLLNYKADGSPFWNQFFVSALKDSDGRVVNYVGVQCEVNLLRVPELRERVKKLPIPTEAFSGPAAGYHPPPYYPSFPPNSSRIASLSQMASFSSSSSTTTNKTPPAGSQINSSNPNPKMATTTTNIYNSSNLPTKPPTVSMK